MKLYVKTLSKRIKGVAVVAALIAGIVGTPVATSTTSLAADATYSCGSYGASTYSNNTGCDGTSVGAPNTGFAKLMEPANLAAIIASLLLLAGGITLMIRSSKNRKKQNVAFTQHD